MTGAPLGIPGELPADLRDLVLEVVSQVPRLLALQDRDPDSPMRGSMHPAYWRDKSSDVADLRRQEAALTFAWLWRFDLPGNRWLGERELLLAARRALGFWCRMQHRDGTFDEWYRNEHGYATTAFSSYAVALAVEALDEALEGPLRAAVLGALRRAGSWLATHDDWFKTNHEAVGVAALGAVGRVLGEQDLLAAASRNAALIVDRMHEEGWSREISGLDVGYTFLLAEYLAMHAVLTGERRFLPAIVRAYDFASCFLHPDLTTGAEYGICGNPYFSRVAAVALAPHGGRAAATLRWMERPAETPRDTAATLKDDLRLARYAFQPLLAALLHLGLLPRRDLGADHAAAAPTPLPFERGRREWWFPEAKLLSVARRGYAAWAAPAHGGLVRIAFRRESGFRPAVVDRGYAIEPAPGRILRNARYDLSASTRHKDGTLETEARFARCAFVMPPYWARVGLRLATATPGGHRWARWLIDQWRRKKGTALNQSAAGVGGGRSDLTLARRIVFDDEDVLIEDTLRAARHPLDPRTIHLVLDGPLAIEGGLEPDEDRRVPLLLVRPDLKAPLRELKVTKRIRAAPESIRVIVGP